MARLPMIFLIAMSTLVFLGFWSVTAPMDDDWE